MSGGQGPDELLPESVAMKMYALTQGIPDDDIFSRSSFKNTLENMRFSKETMIEDFGNANFKPFYYKQLSPFPGGSFRSNGWLKS